MTDCEPGSTAEPQFNAIEMQTAAKIDLIIRKDRPFSREELRHGREATVAAVRGISDAGDGVELDALPLEHDRETMGPSECRGDDTDA